MTVWVDGLGRRIPENDKPPGCVCETGILSRDLFGGKQEIFHCRSEYWEKRFKEASNEARLRLITAIGIAVVSGAIGMAIGGLVW